MPRKTALDALERCRRGGAWSSQMLSSLLERRALPEKDAALCSRLFLGTLQNLLYLDHCVNSYAKTRLEPKVRDILRLGAYQILFMDRIPSSAAVNESVQLCKQCGYGRASGLVNAVLRRMASVGVPPVPDKGSAAYLSVRWSHPQPLVEKLITLRGYDGAEAVLRADNAAAPVYVQTNTTKISSEELAKQLHAQLFPSVPGCIALSKAGNITQLPQYEQGLFFVQDPAARASVLMAEVRSGMKILDACSAPGGKSFAAAVDMQGRGEIVSCDISGAKLALVADGAERMGFDCIGCRVHDARESWEEQFDLVFADVPCSGLGVIRKKPEIRYKRMDDFAALPELQLQIASSLAASVKPGGALAYSTCTWNEQENHCVVEKFLQAHNEFSVEKERTFWPDLDGTDGFYLCLMRREKSI